MGKMSPSKLRKKVSNILVLLMLISNVFVFSGYTGEARAESVDPTLPTTIQNPDFESGDFTGWTKSGSAFDDGPSTAAFFWGDHPFKQNGTHHVWGWKDESSDARTGSLQSNTFRLAGNGEVNFLVGGGKNLDKLYVALVRASDNQILFKATGGAFPDQFERYARVKWDASAYIGEALYIKVVDDNSDNHDGHLNVDDFHVYNVTNDINNPSFEIGNLSGWQVSGDAFVGSNAESYGTNQIPFYQKGENHVWGLAGMADESAADARSGTMTSGSFKLSGTGEVNFLVGGSNNIDNVYVALVRVSDNQELFKATGGNLSGATETYKRVIWDASSYLGEDLYIEVVDKGQGHINVDDFHVYNTNHDIMNPDFETGDLTGWTLVSDDVPGRVTSDVNYWHPKPINKHGEFHFWGEDMKMGTFKSTQFVLGGTGEINFLLGGGNFADTEYVALVNVSDNTILMKATNEMFSDSESYNRVSWDASAYLGEEVYILIEDKVAAGGWKHVNVDDFHVYNLPHDIVNPGFETGDLTGWTVLKGEAPGRVTSDVSYWGDHIINKVGNYHFWGDDGKEGVIASTYFELAGTGEINFMLGGGKSFPDTEYVALVRASDGKELMKATHTAFADTESNDRVVWDASAYLGQQLFIKLVDDIPGGDWQHVNLDDVHVYNTDPTDIQNAGFEAGDLSGWTATGEAFAGVVSSIDNYGSQNKSYDQVGDYHVSGLAGESQDADARLGSLQSSTFKLGGNGEVNFLIGGNNDSNNLYVALVKADDGTVLFQTSGPNDPEYQESYHRIVWDAKNYLGKRLYIKIVDNSFDGHLNVDDFKVYNTVVPSYTMENEDFETGDLSGWTVSENAFAISNLSRDSQGNSYGQQRIYHVVGNNESTGSITSGTFRLTGTGEVNYKISGNNDITILYVALVRAADGKELFKATGSGSEAYQTVQWDASRYLNERLYFKIVDNSTTGHLNVDDFNYYVSHEIINPDFETSDLRGWQVIEGNAFDGVITSQSTHNGTKPFKQNGKYHLWGFQSGGDGRKGILESSHFILSGNPNVITSGRISFLVGGGNDIDNRYVAIVRDKTGEILYKATGTDDEGYSRVDFDATAYIGEELFIRIVDNSTGGWGHINADDFRTVNNPVSRLINPDFEKGNLSGWTLDGKAFENAVSNRTGFGQHGNYFADGNAAADQSLTGTMKSQIFELTGTGIISFLIGGGHDQDHLYVSMIRASDDKELFRATGADSVQLQDVTWEASKYVGEHVYFKVVDEKTTGSFGYISVDDFQFNMPQENYSDKFRPQFHYTPNKNWMNDPNGMVYYEGEYHLFYQHTPFSTSPAFDRMTWGHAVSKDLTHWEELPVALYPDENGAIFSGSAVVDVNNTSGFFDKEGSGLVAIFTENGPKQVQSIAYSKDKGRTWTKYQGNPVLLPGSTSDFRDPKVFWHVATSKWIMTLAVQNRVEFYSSPNLKDWTFASSFGEEGIGSHKGVFECPDLIELPLDGNSTIKKWVLIVSIGDRNGVNPNDPEPPAKGSGAQYYIGTFDGTKFIPDYPSTTSDEPLWVDYGSDFYAGVTWSNILDNQGRPIWLAWMNNWRYASNPPTEKWRGTMSIPRTVELKTTSEGIRLFQSPIKSLEQLRKPIIDWNNFQVEKGDNVLSAVYGNKMEIYAQFDLNDAKEFGFKVRKSDTEETVIGYDAVHQKIFVDRTKSGIVDIDTVFPSKHEAPLAPENNQITLHIFVDSSSVEVFANDGKKVITDQIFPDPDSKGIELYSINGNVRLKSLKIYQLDSIWNDETVKKIQLDTRDYSLNISSSHQSAVTAITLTPDIKTVNQSVYQVVYNPATETSSLINALYPINLYGYSLNSGKKDVTETAIFTTSDASVATVDSHGSVVGLKLGNAIITAEYLSHRATATVTVTSQNPGDTEDSDPETTKDTIIVKDPTKDPTTEVKMDSNTIRITSSLINGIAKSTISSEMLKNALDKVKSDTNGIKKLVLDIQKIDGAEENSVEIPSSYLSSLDAKLQIEIKSPVGSIVVTGNMFANMNLNGQGYVELHIGIVKGSQISESAKAGIGIRPVIEIGASVDGKSISWKNENAPVQVSIHYTPTKDELNNSEHLVVWYLDSAGNIIPIPNGRFDKDSGNVIFETSHFSRYAIAYVNKSFNDIASYSWAKKQIEVLASKGIIKGTNDTTFTPEKNVTRADFLVLLIRALELTAQPDSNFDDVKTSDYFYNELGVSKKLGITNGVDGIHFNPNQEISRQDMMVMLARALVLTKKESITGFNSVIDPFLDGSEVSTYALESVSVLINKGIIEGNNQRIHPLDHAIRAETAVVIYRFMNIK